MVYLPLWKIWVRQLGLRTSQYMESHKLESRRRRTKGSVVGEEWCQNAAPLRWYTKNFFAQSKMILSRAWLHDTVFCAAWNDARKAVYLKPLFKTPCSNCYWGWSKPIMLDYRDISLMESVPLLWRTVTASPWELNPWPFWYLIHNVEKSTFSTGWPPNTPYDCAEARRTQVADATFREFNGSKPPTGEVPWFPPWWWRCRPGAIFPWWLPFGPITPNTVLAPEKHEKNHENCWETWYFNQSE